jgi:hypothetical protein
MSNRRLSILRRRRLCITSPCPKHFRCAGFPDPRVFSIEGPNRPAPAAALYPASPAPRGVSPRPMAQYSSPRLRTRAGRKGCGRCHRVVGLDRRAAVQQLVYDHPTRRFARVVGVRLEGQAPEGKGASLQIVAEASDDLFDQHPLLRIVRRLNAVSTRRQHAPVDAHIVAGADQRLHILGKARPP